MFVKHNKYILDIDNQTNAILDPKKKKKKRKEKTSNKQSKHQATNRSHNCQKRLPPLGKAQGRILSTAGLTVKEGSRGVAGRLPVFCFLARD